jgi:dsDNA-binding SOS-regulon protein
VIEAHAQVPSFADVRVMTTQGRGFTPEEVADRALDKLLYISDSADPMVKAQAMVFKEQVRQVLVFYMNESIKSYKTTLCAELTKQGHGDIAQIVTTV